MTSDEIQAHFGARLKSSSTPKDLELQNETEFNNRGEKDEGISNPGFDEIDIHTS